MLFDISNNCNERMFSLSHQTDKSDTSPIPFPPKRKKEKEKKSSCL